MNIKSYPLLAVVLFVICSCSENGAINNTTRFTKDDFEETISLKGNIVPIDTLWKPTNIWCRDSLLITVDMYSDNFIQVYHKRKGYKVAENIPRGSGPGESLNCWSLQLFSDKLWAFDMQLAKVDAFQIDSFLTRRNNKPIQTVRFVDAAPTGIVVLSDSTFLGTDLGKKDNMVTKYDKEGACIPDFKVAYPEVSGKEIPDNLKKRFWENRIYYNPKTDNVVIFYVYTDLIEIYDSKMQLKKRIQGPDHFMPILGNKNVEGHDFAYVLQDETKFAYLFGVLTDTEIWTLYYGISPEKGKEMQHNLFVFDYDGNPLRHYELDTPILYFSVDQKEHAIYGISEQPDPVIIQFKY